MVNISQDDSDMLRKALYGLAGLVFVAILGATYITRDGHLVTPSGAGSVVVNGKEFEQMPLPAYITEVIDNNYKSYLIEVEPGIKIHMLEVGDGYPVYMQHGNPTSGLLYRKVAANLPREEMRLLMPTMVGLGFSSKIPASHHTLDNHTRWMNAALSQLDLEGVVYVGQDWGGPVGMGALEKSPELLKGMVVMNTGFNAPTEEADLSTAHAMVKSPIFGELILEVFTNVFEQMHNAQGDPESMSDAVKALYAKPVFDSGNSKAAVALMRMVTDGPSHPSTPAMQKIEAYVNKLDIPVEIVWGMQDPILGKALPRMVENFPSARVTETDAGHFLQEEVPAEIAAAIERIVTAVSSKTPSSG